MLPKLNKGNLEKMMIWAYEVDSTTKRPVQPSTEEADRYQVFVNPGKYSLNKMVLRDQRQGHGTSGAPARYLGTAPAEITFQLLFDATGTIPKPSNDIPILGTTLDALNSIDEAAYEVTTEIEKFNTVVFDYNSDGHAPRVVSIVWGDLLVEFAVLTKVNFEYKLFSPDGTPLRALANATFVESPPDVEREAATPSFSPDVTKVHLTKAGDTLSWLADKYYNDPSLYIELARVNGLVDLRSLPAGIRLIIPPLNQKIS